MQDIDSDELLVELDAYNDETSSNINHVTPDSYGD